MEDKIKAEQKEQTEGKADGSFDENIEDKPKEVWELEEVSEDNREEVWELEEASEDESKDTLGFRDYGTLSKEERRGLRKEYFNVINPRVKILRGIGIFFSLVFFTLTGFFFYYLIKFITFENKSIQGFVGYLMTPVALIVAAIFSPIFEGFENWLFRKNKILVGRRFNNRKEINDSLTQNKERLYDELEPNEKRTLYKEFIAKSPLAKFWRILGFVCLGLFAIVIGLLVYSLVAWLFLGGQASRVWGWVFFMPSNGSLSFFVYWTFYNQFINWLEYEKNITKNRISPKS